MKDDLHALAYHFERTAKKTKEETFPRNRDNWDMIQSYLNDMRLQGGKKGRPAKAGTLLKHCHVLRWFSGIANKTNFKKMTYDQIIAALLYAPQDCPVADQKRKLVMKKFYRYLHEVHNCKTHLNNLKVPKPDKKKLDPRTMLNPEHIFDLTDPWRGKGATKSIKEQLFIRVIFESLMRPGELLKCQIKHIDLAATPIKIHIPKENTKTFAHDTFLANDVGAADMLRNYLKIYPLAPDDYLFSMGYSYARERIMDITERVLGRKIKLYLFRHSRVTWLKYLGVPKDIIQSMAGQTTDGDVVDTDYTHIGEQHIVPWVTAVPLLERKVNTPALPIRTTSAHP